MKAKSTFHISGIVDRCLSVWNREISLPFPFPLDFICYRMADLAFLFRFFEAYVAGVRMGRRRELGRETMREGGGRRGTVRDPK